MNKQIEIPITILTNDEYNADDANAVAVEQVEFSHLYLVTIFNLIRSSANDFQSSLQSEEHDQFRYDLKNIANIGSAVVENARRAISELTDLQKPDAPNEIEAVKQNPDHLAALAAQLSAFLNDENLPVGIYNRIMQAVDDIENEATSEELHRAGTSPDYLKAVFSAYERNQSEAE